jgi:predicted P-loop ATPase
VSSLTISVFANTRDNRPATADVEWPTFFLDPVVIRRKQDKDTLALWQPCTYLDGATRSNANVEQVTAFVQDFDFQGQTVDETVAAWGDYECVVHTTASHTPEWNKFRVIVPLTRPMSRDEHKAMWRWVEAAAKEDGRKAICPINKDSRAVSQPMFLPCVVEGVPKAGSWHYDGRRFDPDTLGPYMAAQVTGEASPKVVSRPPGQPASAIERTTAEELLRKMCARMAATEKGDRHSTLLKIAYAIGGLIAAGRLDADVAFAAVVEAGCSKGRPQEVVEGIVRDQFTAGAEKPLWGELEDVQAAEQEALSDMEAARQAVAEAVRKEVLAKEETKHGGNYEAYVNAKAAVGVAREMFREAQREHRKAQTEARKAVEKAARLAKQAEQKTRMLANADPNTANMLQSAPTGLPMSNLFNLVMVLENDPQFAGQFVYDTFAEKIVVSGIEATDHMDTWINCDIQSRYMINAPTALLREAIIAVSRNHETHPVREYLNGLVWDGIERLPSLMKRGFRVSSPDEDLLIDAGVKFCVSAVARILDPREDGNGGPGCKVDTLLVFVGNQGAKKSSAFAALASPLWFSDTHMDLSNKDAYMQIQGVWLYELSELDSLRKAENSRVKAFITSQWDNYRPPYGHRTVKRPRQGVLVGTTNEKEFLSDATGSRRFVPMTLQEGREADLNWIREKRDQLWAEAVVRYHEGESWWYEGIEAERLATQSEAHNQEDPWEEIVANYLALQERTPEPARAIITTTSLLTGAVRMLAAQVNKLHTNRMATVLRRLGMEMKQIRLPNGTSPRIWIRKGQEGGNDVPRMQTPQQQSASNSNSQVGTQRPGAM